MGKRGHQSLLGAVYVIEYQTGRYSIIKSFANFVTIATCIELGQRYCRFPGGRNLMKAILMLAQVLWSPWDLFNFSNVLFDEGKASWRRLR